MKLGRFWGKIIGKPKNYYVIEAELLEEEMLARRKSESENVGGTQNETTNETNEQLEESAEKEEKDTDKKEEFSAKEFSNLNESSQKLELAFPPAPKNTWKEEPTVPAEIIGTGVNKNIYFVCNKVGIEEWTELPSVTPQQIIVARQIVRAFTGNLDTPIHTFPPFPGTEKNYLRAQIARISGATLVSPIGFFTFGEQPIDDDVDERPDTEIEDEEDESGSGIISKNRHYEPLPLKELIEPTLSNWCHHSPYILKQGRTTWWNPRKARTEEEMDVGDTEEEEEEDEEDEEEDEEGEREEESREVGPGLLTPLSEDSRLFDSIVAWTARASSTIKSDRTTIAIVRSNIWPGSFALAAGKKFANVYFGTGHKFNPYNYSPPEISMVQEEYPIGPEVIEMQDPSFEAEEAHRISQLPLDESAQIEDEEEEEDDEEDEDDEDD